MTQQPARAYMITPKVLGLLSTIVLFTQAYASDQSSSVAATAENGGKIHSQAMAFQNYQLANQAPDQQDDAFQTNGLNLATNLEEDLDQELAQINQAQPTPVRSIGLKRLQAFRVKKASKLLKLEIDDAKKAGQSNTDPSFIYPDSPKLTPKPTYYNNQNSTDYTDLSILSIEAMMSAIMHKVTPLT